MLTRKIGAALRGKATPLQITLATVFGALLGFVPGFFLPGDLGGGFAQAPGLILFLLVCVLVVNANLAVFGLTLLVSKLLSFALLPVSYAVGTWLLDGPLSGLFETLVNMKGTAWFGLEYYATTGGLVVGLVFGVLFGFVLNRAVRALRQRMADAEENSERYRKYASKWWVRLLSWAFLGKGKGKKTTWRELSERDKLGMPVRIVGIVAAVLLVGGVWTFQSFFSAPLLRSGVRAGLESVNGATVDVEQASLGLSNGTLRVEGLAMADLQDLQKDVFAADALVATVDTGELLRKRLVIDELRASNARSGTARTTPGERLPDAEPEPEPEPAPEGVPTIEDYLEDFEEWKARIEQWREWLEGFAGGDEPPAEQTPEQREQERERQEQQGLASVVATHLLRESPRIVIRKVTIEGISFTIDGVEDKLDLNFQNLSDAPSLLADVPSAKFHVQSDWLDLQLTGPVAKTGSAVGVAFALKDLPVDKLFGQLKIDGKPPVSGGTFDFATTGAIGGFDGTGVTVELPLQVKMKGATFAFAGMQPTTVDELLLPVGLSGPLLQPAVTFDAKVFQQALVDAGQRELANFVQGHAAELFGGALPIDLNQAPGQMVDDAQKKLEDEAKKAAEEAKKKLLEGKLPGGLKGLLPGGGK